VQKRLKNRPGQAGGDASKGISIHSKHIYNALEMLNLSG